MAGDQQVEQRTDTGGKRTDNLKSVINIIHLVRQSKRADNITRVLWLNDFDPRALQLPSYFVPAPQNMNSEVSE